MWLQLFIFIVALWGLKTYPENGNVYQQQKARKKYIILIMLLFIIQSGFRHLAVGTDTFSFYQDFKEIQQMSFTDLVNSFVNFVRTDEGKDPGYKILQYLFATILPSFRLFLLSIAIFIFFALGKLLYRYTNSNKEVLVAVALYQCLYYSFLSITGLRQTIATGFLLFAVPYILEKKWGKALLLILIASTQHKSALLFVPFLALPYIKNSRNLIICAFIVFFPMWKMGNSIAVFFMSGTRFEQYAMFLEGFDGAGAYNFTAFIVLLVVGLFLKNRQVTSINQYSYVFINAVSVAFALTPLTLIDPSNMRIVQYYSIFCLISLPHLLTSIKRNGGSFDLHMIVFFVFSLYTVFGLQYDYCFFWQDMRLGSNYGLSVPFNEFDI